MSQAYRVKNTFAEHPEESDDEAPPMQRSNSWSGSTSTMSISSERSHNITAATSSSSHLPNFFARALQESIDEPPPARGSHNAAPGSVEGHSVEEDGKEVDVGHVVFESDSRESSICFDDSSASSEKTVSQATSMAGQMHARMHCTPCLRFILKDGCKDGKICKFCHLDHTGEKLRQRPSKAVRSSCKRVIQDIFDSQSDMNNRLDQLQVLVAPQNPFIRRLLVQQISRYEDPPVLHTAGQIDRSDNSPQLWPDGPNFARAALEGDQAQALLLTKKVADGRHRRGRTSLKESIKSAAQLARGAQRLEEPVVPAVGSTAGSKTPAPPLLEPGRVKVKISL